MEDAGTARIALEEYVDAVDKQSMSHSRHVPPAVRLTNGQGYPGREGQGPNRRTVRP